ncbi:MAG: polysaccharide biosynthesis C-terminal domain-containing protein [Firmicutes bacterium]|nr:polysaccharide biosynthesis C-terminal domain-containing protein [Bacillota bacterium]
MKLTALRRAFRNDYVYTVGTKIAIAAIGIIASAFAKRFFGPAIEGEVDYIESALTTVAVIANLGIYQPFPFYKRQLGDDALDKFLNLFLLQYLCYQALGILILLLFRNFIVTAICLIAPLQVFANQLSFAVMVEHVRHKNKIFLTARLLNTAFIIFAYFFLRPAVLLSLTMLVIGDAVTIVLTLRRFGRTGNPLKADFSFLRKILPFSLVAMATALLVTLNYKMDGLMLGWMGIEAAQRGFYRTGASFAGYGWLIPEAFREVLSARTARSDAIEDVTRSLKFNFYITLVILMGIAVFGRLVLFVLYGEVFLPAYPVTLVLLTGILSMSYFKIIGTLYLAQGKKWIYMFSLLASVAVNIIANYFFIPPYGIMGAAWASVLSYTIAGIFFLFHFARTYQIPFKTLFIPTRREIGALFGRNKLS